MNNDSETSQFKYYGGLCFLLGMAAASCPLIIGPSGTVLGVTTPLWIVLGILSIWTGRFIDLLKARIEVLEAKLSEAETTETTTASSTEN